ncbi:DUF6401 family natural product biosynthesis protein [Micromonospora endolithica]|uniref:Uncharacterized protein n=1 Tax=Micromonospora endolithica TaxID=230091 RepID=A0A3A9YVX1_9ACTN|nr:DUF6401 family natural product biosynthesis protein [Micromonospora endolithica]RKN39357.1 hypothetical protein D7223_28940 [Micromonospora endolithica]TWJ22718.1 hypothetical protein JD76_02840 [Micromonospora endolithica]
MRPPLHQVRARTVVQSARSTLTALADSVAEGVAAATTRPGLLALVDQHAAAIRESLDGDRRPLSAAALAGYAEGVRTAALQHDWQPPTGPVDWSAPDWTLTRLLAVCALARTLGGPRPGPLPPL